MLLCKLQCLKGNFQWYFKLAHQHFGAGDEVLGSLHITGIQLTISTTHNHNGILSYNERKP